LTLPAVLPPAQTKALPVTPDYSIAFNAAVYATAIVVLGVVLVLAISVWKTNSEHRADVIRAVGDLFRAVAEMFRALAEWFRRGGPPGAV
jgi:hypothetical protein